jgi:hypothetical protein
MRLTIISLWTGTGTSTKTAHYPALYCIDKGEEYA